MGKINSTPVEGYILVRPLETKQSVKGMELHGVDEQPQLAKVLKVGKDTYYDNTEKVREAPCKVGDTIVHSSVGWENITLEGEELRMVPFSKVLLVS